MRANLRATLLIAGLSWLATSAQAATLRLDPTSTSAIVGDLVTLSVVGEFGAAGTLGGGFDLFFDDSLLDFVSFEFDANLMDDPAFRRAPDVLAGELNGIAFGEFDGYTGDVLIGAVTFLAIGEGIVDLMLAVNEGGPPSNPGPFVDLQGFEILDVTTVGAQLDLQPIPVPAAAWLLASALAALGLGRARAR